MVPLQYWLVLQDEAPAPDPTPRQLHGFLSHTWLQDDHAAAKPWVVNGWPVRAGGSSAWSWTWVDDRNAPSRDPRELVGERVRFGSSWKRVLSVTQVLACSFGELVEGSFGRGPLSDTCAVTTRTPVSMKRKDEHGRTSWATGPTPERLFGVTPRHDRFRNVSGGREGGVFDVVAASDESLALHIESAAHDLLPRLRVMSRPGEIRTSRTREPDRQGWEGTFQVSIAAGRPHDVAVLQTLLRLTELVGLGSGTAWGFGSLVASPVRRLAPAPVPVVRTERLVAAR